jgi:RHH-type transcriptional regulator, proline utilization regulon repressor / proline dehydrogenase / delta 1-pyrroline-5-carboxylate dehydrogenase
MNFTDDNDISLNIASNFKVENLPTEPPLGSYNNLPSLTLDEIVKEFGREIFSSLKDNKPIFFSKNNLSQNILNWSLGKPELKVNLFRLIDVLPTLESSAEIAIHAQEYLGDEAAKLNPVFGWGIKAPPKSLRAKLLAYGIKRSISEMASLFIAGSDTKTALKELKRLRRSGFPFTVDLLGEYCLSDKEAKDYLKRYLECIETFKSEIPRWKENREIIEGHLGEASIPNLSVKLSALYTSCYPLNFSRSVEVLAERIGKIIAKASEIGCQIYFDAEDFAKREIIVEVFKKVYSNPKFKDIFLPGIVVQAYARDAEVLIEELIDFARKRGKIAIRLVKGAYWDSETAECEQRGWRSPLFSEKTHTDYNFEKLTKALLDNVDLVYPAIGSHNIRSLAYACKYAEQLGVAPTNFELQVLYGMADSIALAFKQRGYLVRHYVPVGELIPGMGYFVRRLLENTSNESFLRHTFFDETKVDLLLEKPTAENQLSL